MRRCSVGLLFGALLLMSGCSSVPLIAGVVSGGVAGGATANPAVGFAVGVGVDAATGASVRWFGRSRQHAEQDAIAAVAGSLPDGGRAPWRINHFLPFGNEHGQLQVVRVVDTPLGACREIVFSVADDAAPEHWYTASVCQHEIGWRWATAEPAVARWGHLQ
jgi:hypothetical protein